MLYVIPIKGKGDAFRRFIDDRKNFLRYTNIIKKTPQGFRCISFALPLVQRPMMMDENLTRGISTKKCVRME
jgi:hypothetical protein